MRKLYALVAVLGLLLAACGGDDAAVEAPDALKGVQVTGEFGKKADIKLPEGFKVTESAEQVLENGDGAEIEKGQTILVQIVSMTAKKQQAANTYESGSAFSFTLTEDFAAQRGAPAGFIDVLVGKHTGDRVLSVLTAKDAGVQEPLVTVFDIEKAADPEPLNEITGDAAELPAGTPQLKLDGDGVPTGFDGAGAGKAPKTLEKHILVEGDGPAIEKGDLVTFHYLGQVYPDGKVFDASYPRGEPTPFQVGVGSLIKGWDEGLVGLKKGTRVVLEIPSDLGYGDQGQPPAIKGGDSLIFVVDILGVS